MKIVILGTRGFPNIQGGVEKHCEGLATNLVKLGCEVIVFTRKPYVKEDIKEYKGVKLVSLFTIRQKSLEAFLHTFIGVFASLRYKPDILHIQAIGPALFTPLARILGMKVIVTSHGSNYKHLKWGKAAKLVLRLAELLGVKFANEVIAISKGIADEIKSKYHRKATVIYNGVVRPQVLQTKDSLKKYALEEGKYILSVGRFVPAKGFDYLIDAFEKARINTDERRMHKNESNKLKQNNWKLVIVGDADHEDKYCLDLKEKAKGNNDIILTGFLNGKPLQELYSHAAVFVLASYYEGLPTVLVEAISYDLPCIASDIRGNRDVGLKVESFFQTGNVKSLAGKIKEFTEKLSNKQDMTKQSSFIQERHNWSKIADKTLKVYRQVSMLHES